MKVMASKALTYTITGAILLSGALFAFMALAPVDVLSNWSLSVDASKQYPEGSTIVVETRFNKLRSVTGISKRYIVCDTPNRSNVRIPVNEAAADRSQSKNNNELIYLAIPQSIPSLPSTCQIEIVIEYTIYSFRKHVESVKSNSFTVIEEKNQEDPLSVSPDSDNMVVENAPPTKSPNARIVPLEPTFSPQQVTSPPDNTDNQEEENSPRVPPCQTFLINALGIQVCL